MSGVGSQTPSTVAPVTNDSKISTTTSSSVSVTTITTESAASINNQAVLMNISSRPPNTPPTLTNVSRPSNTPTPNKPSGVPTLPRTLMKITPHPNSKPSQK